MKKPTLTVAIALNLSLAIGCTPFKFATPSSTVRSAPGDLAGSREPAAPNQTPPPNQNQPVPSGPTDFPARPPLVALPPGLGTFKILDELASLKKGAEQNLHFCKGSANQYPDDPVRKAFCGSTFPNVRSLRELMTVLGLTTDFDGGSRVAISTHSTSINPRTTSIINPRYFLFQPLALSDIRAPGSRVILTYSRGEPYIEIAGYNFTRTTTDTHPNFYLIRFEKECEKTNSCSAAHFLTSEFENNWSGITIYEDNDLVHTPLNCLGCHADDSKGVIYRKGSKVLLMREEFELDFWPHWMEGGSREDATRKILADFLGQDAEKSVVDSKAFSKSRPGDLWQHTYLTQHVSENPFTFKPEHRAIGQKPTLEWLNLFKLFEDGKSNPVPHFMDDVFDPNLVAAATKVMGSYLAGQIAQSQLPDFRDVFPESEKVNLGHRINGSFSADKLLVAACGHCHRPESVRSFKVSQLGSLSTEMKVEIIRRVSLPDSDYQKMPPVRFRELSPSQIQSIASFLK